MLKEIITIVFLSAIFLFVPKGDSALIIWIGLIINYIILFKSLKKPLEVGNIATFFKIDLLFYLFYFVIFFLPYQTYVLGLSNIENNSWLHQNTYVDYTNKAVLASAIGMLSFYIGFNLPLKITKTKIPSVRSTIKVKDVLKFYYLIILVSLLFIVLFIFLGGSQMLVSSYLGTRTENAKIDGVYNILTTFISILGATCILVYRYKQNISITLVGLIPVILFSCFLLVIGDRNTFFIIAICTGGAYFTFINSISRKKLFLLAFGALFIYQVVEISRMSEKRDLNSIISVITGDNTTRTTSTLSVNIDQGSFSLTNIVTRSVFQYVPHDHDFFWGKFKVIGIAGLVPYARGFIISDRDRYISSSRFLTDKIGAHFGLGTSIVADSYIEFGILSLFIFLFLLGLIARKIMLKTMEGNSFKWFIIYALSLGIFAEIPRYSFDFIFKTIGWALIFFYLTEKLILKKKI